MYTTDADDLSTEFKGFPGRASPIPSSNNSSSTMVARPDEDINSKEIFSVAITAPMPGGCHLATLLLSFVSVRYYLTFIYLP